VKKVRKTSTPPTASTVRRSSKRGAEDNNVS
jgi:hypothetical protein